MIYAPSHAVVPVLTQNTWLIIILESYFLQANHNILTCSSIALCNEEALPCSPVLDFLKVFNNVNLTAWHKLVWACKPYLIHVVILFFPAWIKAVSLLLQCRVLWMLPLWQQVSLLFWCRFDHPLRQWACLFVCRQAGQDRTGRTCWVHL